MTAVRSSSAFGALAGSVTTFLLYLLLLRSMPIVFADAHWSESAQRDAGRYLEGMAQAVHDLSQISKRRHVCKKDDPPMKCS